MNGSLTQAASGTYQVETNSAGQSDRINVTGTPGTAALGGTVSVVGASGVQAPRTTYTILNASGGVAGTFASANSLYPFLLPSLSYDANNVYLTLQVGGFAAAATDDDATGRRPRARCQCLHRERAISRRCSGPWPPTRSLRRSRRRR